MACIRDGRKVEVDRRARANCRIQEGFPARHIGALAALFAIRPERPSQS
jgi:hypothetical protein